MPETPSKRRHSGSGDREDLSFHTSPASLSRPISPPPNKKVKSVSVKETQERICLASPFHLTRIKDLPDKDNVDAISLRDLVGDPLIAELWDFNYLHDIDFLVGHLDRDTRALTKVHVVHGFWKRDDRNKLLLEAQAAQYENVSLHTAYMPEIFGTHHSKMLVLLRHDGTAQVIIHTANMIAKDWTNMTNGIWQSPILPKLQSRQRVPQVDMKIGRGDRFKFDLLNYLRAYNKVRGVCTPLVRELEKYDFSSIRGALIASVPGKHPVDHGPGATRWGWQALKETLREVPAQAGKSDIVMQISSIATLGANDTWLQRMLFDSLAASASPSSPGSRPKFKIIFPTADEIRRSLDGYASGGSIHTKIQSSAQSKQLQYLRPLLHHWANDCEDGLTISSALAHQDGGRKRAAPHIKTYIRHGEKSIDWALLTSANISKQAWGEAVNQAGEVRIASWEIGVLIWPELLTGNTQGRMLGAFKADSLLDGDTLDDKEHPTVALRIPYNMPLQKYSSSEAPWVATMSYTEPDWMGQVWP
ncbi:tyrosyl-DNA phosphodiesterase [Xylariaceae sp. FL0594]|nr:tyrosyl-DNA phosphodiesterase [Xylariaceae sp. FL0594]